MLSDLFDSFLYPLGLLYILSNTQCIDSKIKLFTVQLQTQKPNKYYFWVHSHIGIAGNEQANHFQPNPTTIFLILKHILLTSSLSIEALQSILRLTNKIV